MGYIKPLNDYSASLDFDPQVFRDMRDVAEKVMGVLSLTPEGRVVITLTGPHAVEHAAIITADDFPHGFVEPGDDSTLVFSF